MKSKNIFSVLIVLGITVLAFWGANRLHTFLTTPDAIGEVEVDKDGTVKRDTEIYTEEELFTQRLSNPRAGDIYLIK